MSFCFVSALRRWMESLNIPESDYEKYAKHEEVVTQVYYQCKQAFTYHCILSALRDHIPPNNNEANITSKELKKFVIQKVKSISEITTVDNEQFAKTEEAIELISKDAAEVVVLLNELIGEDSTEDKFTDFLDIIDLMLKTLQRMSIHVNNAQEQFELYTQDK